ncbi:dihydrodipicolinate synthase family protein [Ruegeria sp. 2205SS24-7]|uniref:dihydrodipicolinate synthase family protein n=1 Tax=Ruegeria discodermiae TaxID=3064389 RepID=UPI002741E4F6|nr:dihydrodipicolinate synthase family protein [Ruegeria sp. 2205SS24-7]MDP5218500.1 dihydrodipicolinate synthase family protein [Ruegeria sp. 2205SS24-7]
MLTLPTYAGTLEPYALSGTPIAPRAPKNAFNRTAFAAAHVVSDPLAERDPWLGQPAVDWDNTLKFRHYLFDQGLGLAEAMDTAQRGMGVDWLTAKELIERTMVEAKAHPLSPRVACGAGTDHVATGNLTTADALIAAYCEQMEAIEKAGGQIIIMASRAMAAQGNGPEFYAQVYGHLIEQAADPVILHWLGDMFDPALKGYWGHDDLDAATEAVLALLKDHAPRIDGIKISLLEQSREEAFRARLPDGVRLYTGDDFNYTALIEGDGRHFSHALLGIFAAIAPAAAQALEALAEGDNGRFHELLAPTVPLSREIFKAPTQFYKAGIAFLAWLNGAQSHFIMPQGFQSSREIAHYAEVFRLADTAGMLSKPALADQRMRQLLGLYGIG